jgi:hypothetical protein
MPRATVWFLRAALVHLLAGFAAGGLLLAARDIPLPLPAGVLPGAHRDLVLVGWMAQVTLGVAWWILPRRPAGSPARGPAWPVAAAWALLNGGVLLAVAGRAAGGGPAAGHLAMAAGGTLAALALLPRVRAAGR